jgi:hypothetical protein
VNGVEPLRCARMLAVGPLCLWVVPIDHPPRCCRAVSQVHVSVPRSLHTGTEPETCDGACDWAHGETRQGSCGFSLDACAELVGGCSAAPQCRTPPIGSVEQGPTAHCGSCWTCRFFGGSLSDRNALLKSRGAPRRGLRVRSWSDGQCGQPRVDRAAFITIRK